MCVCVFHTLTDNSSQNRYVVCGVYVNRDTDASNKCAFWTTFDKAMEEVPRHEQLFVLMDANARTGRREKGGVGSKDNKNLGAHG